MGLVPTSNHQDVLFAIQVEFSMYCKIYLSSYTISMPMYLYSLVVRVRLVCGRDDLHS